VHEEPGGQATSGDARVNEQGEMVLPAHIRSRWVLDQGGQVGWLDLGDAILLVPGSIGDLRRDLLEHADWESARTGFGDPDLANQ
jgi:hypothetical protein